MSIHSEYQDLMVDVLFGDASPEAEQKLEAHLEDCEACADEFASLQQTLSIAAERERESPPEAFWSSYRYRLERRMEREAQSQTPSSIDRLQRWWRSLPAVLPQTSPQWALQGAFTAAVLVLGVWLGGGVPGSSTGGAPLDLGAQSGDAAGGISDLMLASQPVSSPLGTARPSIAGVRDITYDVTAGTVEIRYNTVTDVVVRGAPQDPAVQRLLRAAMLDERNPSSRLHAVKTLEAAAVAPDAMAPDADLAEALRVIAMEERDPGLRLRAVRALRALYTNRTMDATTKNLLVGILTDDAPTALRIEAMEALTASRWDPDASTGFLYQVRSDSNRFLRHRAEEFLQRSGPPALQPTLQTN